MELEKQNQELRAELKKSRTASDYELQARCALDSKAWFGQNWPSDKDTMLLTYRNHYHVSSNKCYAVVEYRQKYGAQQWAEMISLWDVSENSRIGSIAMQHDPRSRAADTVMDCKVNGESCRSEEEFNKLLRPYMSE